MELVQVIAITTARTTLARVPVLKSVLIQSQLRLEPRLRHEGIIKPKEQ